MSKEERTRYEKIRSSRNPLLREVGRLQKSKRHRLEQGLIVLEGSTLVREALDAHIEFWTLIVSESFHEAAARGTTMDESLRRVEEHAQRRVSLPDHVFRRISSQATPQGILVIAHRPRNNLSDRFPSANEAPLLVASGVQDPGNLGSLGRTAEAAGCGGIIVCGESADPYSSKTLRGSMGSLLRLPLVEAAQEVDVARFVRGLGWTLVGAVPTLGTDYRSFEWTTPFALFVGGEARGLPPVILEQLDARVSIPMQSTVESLNVSVASGILLFEAMRQRAAPPTR